MNQTWDAQAARLIKILNTESSTSTSVISALRDANSSTEKLNSQKPTTLECLKWNNTSLPEICRALIRRKRVFSGVEREEALTFIEFIIDQSLHYMSDRAIEDNIELVYPIILDPEAPFWSLHCAAETYASIKKFPIILPRPKRVIDPLQQIQGPSDIECQKSKTFEEWRSKVSKGDIVDAWTLGEAPDNRKMEPRGWHKCTIVSVNDYRDCIQVFRNGEPSQQSLWLPFENVVPCGTFSDHYTNKDDSLCSDANQSIDIESDVSHLTAEDITWRDSLRIGSVIDAMDDDGVWLRSIVVDLSSEPVPSIINSTVSLQGQNRLRVSFIGFPCNRDQILGRYSPYICRLNLRSGGKRGPAELPWNIESDEERDMTPYLNPQFIDMTEDTTLFQYRYCSPFAIQKSEIFFDRIISFYINSDDDASPGAIYPSDRFLRKVNGAFIDGGHDLPISFLTLWTPMLGKAADLFSNHGIDFILKPFVSCVIRWVQRPTLQWKDDIRHLTKESIEAILLGMYRISRRWLSKEECGKLVEETIALGIIWQQFRSGVNMKRFEALRLLQELANMCRNAEEHPFGIKRVANEEFVRVPISLYLRSSMLAQWILEKSLVTDIFVANQYRELVRLSGDVVLLLSEHRLVQEKDIKDIWTSFESTDELDVESAVDMLSGIISRLKTNTCSRLLNAAIKASGTHFPIQTARLFHVFACRQMRSDEQLDEHLIHRERDSAMTSNTQGQDFVFRSLECLFLLSLGIPFSVINLSETCTSGLSEDVALSTASLRFLTDSLRLNRFETFRMTILTLCVRNIAHHVFVMRSINIIKAILSLYPPLGMTPRLPNGSSISLQQEQTQNAPTSPRGSKRTNDTAILLQQEQTQNAPTSPRGSKRSLLSPSESNGSSESIFSTTSKGIIEPNQRNEFHEDVKLESTVTLLDHADDVSTNSKIEPMTLQQPMLVDSLSPKTHDAVLLARNQSNLEPRDCSPPSIIAYRMNTSADVITELNKTCNLTAVLIRHLLTYCGAAQRVVSDLNLIPASQNFLKRRKESDILQDEGGSADGDATSFLDEQDVEILSSDDPSSSPTYIPNNDIKSLQLDPVQLSLKLPTSISRNSPFLRGFHNIFDFLGTALAENENVFLDATQALQLWDACVSRAVTEKQRDCSILWFVKGAESLARVTLGRDKALGRDKDKRDLDEGMQLTTDSFSSAEYSSSQLSGFGILFLPEIALRLFREKLLKTNTANLDSTLYSAWRTFFLFTAGFRGHIEFFGGVPDLSDVGSSPKERRVLSNSQDSVTTTTFTFPMPICECFEPKSAIRFINHDPEGMIDLWNIALHANSALVSRSGSFLLTFLLERVSDKNASAQLAHKQLRRSYVHRCMQEIHSAIDSQVVSLSSSISVEMTVNRCVGLLDGIVNESESETSEVFILLQCALVAAMNFDPLVLGRSGIAPQIEAACSRARSLLTFASHSPDAYSLFDAERGDTKRGRVDNASILNIASKHIDPDLSMTVKLRFMDVLLPNIGSRPLLPSSMDTSGAEKTASNPKVGDHSLFMCSHEKLRDLFVLVSALTGVPTRRLTIRSLSKPILLSNAVLGKTFAELNINQSEIYFFVKSDDSNDKLSIIDDLLAIDRSIKEGVAETLTPSQLLTIFETLLERAQSLPAVFLSGDRKNLDLFFSYLDNSSSTSSTTSSTVWKFLCRLPTSPSLLELLALGNMKTVDWSKVFPASSPSFRLYSSLLLRRLTSPGSRPGLGLCNKGSSFDGFAKTAISRTKESFSTISTVHIHGAMLIDDAIRRLVRGNAESSVSNPSSAPGMGDALTADSFKFLFNDFARNGLKLVFSLFSKASTSFPGSILFKIPDSALDCTSAASVITYFRIVQRFVLSSAIADSTHIARVCFLNQNVDVSALDNVRPDALIHEAKPSHEIDASLARSILDRPLLHSLQLTLISILKQHLNTEDVAYMDDTFQDADPIHSLLQSIGLQTIASCIFLLSALCIYDIQLWNDHIDSISPLLSRLLRGPQSMLHSSKGLDISENNKVLKLQCAVVSALMSISSLCQQKNKDESLSPPSSFILDLLISSRPKASSYNNGTSISLYYALFETLLRDKLDSLQRPSSTSLSLPPTIELPGSLLSLLKELFVEIKSPSMILETPLSAAAANAALRQSEEPNSFLFGKTRANQKSSVSVSNMSSSVDDGNAKLISPLSDTVSFTRALLCTALNSHLQRLRPLYALIPMHRGFLSLGRDPASTSCWETKFVLKRALMEALNSHPDSILLKTPTDLFDSPAADAVINGALLGFGSDAAQNIVFDPESTEGTIISSLIGVDHSLVGCCRIASALIEADPSSSTKLLSTDSLECVKEVYFSLFPLEPPPPVVAVDAKLVEFPSDSGIKWPRFISNATRGAAFNLLLALIRRNPLNTVSLLELLDKKTAQNFDGDEIDSLNVCLRPPHSGVFEQSPTGYVGIHNLGATCYMNSLLQQLYMIEPIRYGLLSVTQNDTDLETETNFVNTLRDGSFFYQIQRVMGLLEHSVKASILPKLCATIIGADGKGAHEYEQQDAQEFLMVLFDKIDLILSNTPQASLITDELRYETSEVKICTGGCNTVRNHPIPGDLNLRLEPRSMDLIKALDHLSQWEEIQGFDCQECQKKTVLRKRSAFTKIGNTLICHLKRFDMNWDTQVISKINSRFEFPRELDLSPYCFDSLSRDPDIIAAGGMNSAAPPRPLDYWQFELVGVVVHTGEYSHGHYYSFIRERGELTKKLKRDYSPPFYSNRSSTSSTSGSASRREEKCPQRWFEFNDDRVTDWDPVNLERECFGGVNSVSSDGFNSGGEVVAKNAYMLVYERKKEKPSAVAVNEIETSRALLFSKKLIPRSIATEIINENIIFSRTLALTETHMAKFMLALVDTVSRQPSVLNQYFPPISTPFPVLDPLISHKPVLDIKTVFRSLFVYFAYPIAMGTNAPIAPHYAYALSRLIGSNSEIAALLAQEIVCTETYNADTTELLPLCGRQFYSDKESWFRSAIFSENSIIRYSMSRIFATCLSVLGMSSSVLDYKPKKSKFQQTPTLCATYEVNPDENSLRLPAFELLDTFFNFKSTNFAKLLACNKFHTFDAFFAGVYDALRLGFGSGLPLQFHGLYSTEVSTLTSDQAISVSSAIDNWVSGESPLFGLNPLAIDLLEKYWKKLTDPLTSPKAASLGVTLELAASFRLGLLSLNTRKWLASEWFGTAAIFDLFLQENSVNRGITRYTMRNKSMSPTWTRALDLAALLIKTSYTPSGYGISGSIGSSFHTCLGPVRSASHIPSLGLFGKRPSQRNLTSIVVDDNKSTLDTKKHLPVTFEQSRVTHKNLTKLFASAEAVMPPFEAFSLTLPEPSSVDREILRRHAIRVITFPDFLKSKLQRFQVFAKSRDASETFEFQGLLLPKHCSTSILDKSHAMPAADFDLSNSSPLTLALDGRNVERPFNNCTQTLLFNEENESTVLGKLLGVEVQYSDAHFPDVYGTNIEANVAILGHVLFCSYHNKLTRPYPQFCDILKSLLSNANHPDTLRASFAVLEPLLMVHDELQFARMEYTVTKLYEKVAEKNHSSFVSRLTSIECALAITRLFSLDPDFFSKWNDEKKHFAKAKLPDDSSFDFNIYRYRLEKVLLAAQTDPTLHLTSAPAWQLACVLEHWGDQYIEEKEVVSAEDILASMQIGHVIGAVVQTQSHVFEIPYRRYLTRFMAGQPVHSLSLREEIFCIVEARMTLSLRAVIARQRLALALQSIRHVDRTPNIHSPRILFSRAILALYKV